MKPANKPTATDQKAILAAMNQTVAAWLVGKHPRTFRDLDAPRNADGTYNAPQLVAWLLGTAAGTDDPLLAGGTDSPFLERYRKARAEVAEMDLLERRGKLIDVDQFNEWWASEVAAPIRRALETLAARFGADAAEIVASAIRKAEAAREKRSPAE